MVRARIKPPSGKQDEQEEIPWQDLKEAEFDFMNDRITTKSGKVYENVQVSLDDLRRWLKEKHAH